MDLSTEIAWRAGALVATRVGPKFTLTSTRTTRSTSASSATRDRACDHRDVKIGM